MFLFQKYRIVYGKLHMECRLIKSQTRLDALVWIAAKNRYDTQNTPENFRFVEFMIEKYERIVDKMQHDDPRLDALEKQHGVDYWDKKHWSLPTPEPTIELKQLLQIGIEVNAITEEQLEQFVMKKDEFEYRLTDIDFDTDDSKFPY